MRLWVKTGGGGSAGKTRKGRNVVSRPPVSGLAWLGDVPGLGSLRTVDNLEFDLLAFLEGPEAGTLNRGEVHEDVVASFALDEAITFSVVEPLDLARNTHRTCLPCEIGDGESGALEKKDRTCGLYFDDGPAQRRSVILVGRPGPVKSYPEPFRIHKDS